MPEPLLYCRAAGAAAIVGAIAVVTIARIRRPASDAGLNRATVMGIGLGLASGFCVLTLRWTWPPVSALDRFATIVFPAILGIEFLATYQHVPRWIAWLLRWSLAAAIPKLLLYGSVYLGERAESWTWWQTSVTMLACFLLLAGTWSLLSRLSHRGPGISISLAIFLAISCAGRTILMAGYIQGGAATFVCAAVILATALAAHCSANAGRFSRSFPLPATLGIGLVGLFSLLFVGRFFGRLSTASALAILLAPLLCWTTELPRFRYASDWLTGTIRIVLVAIPLVAVLVFAKRDFDRELAPLLGGVEVSTQGVAKSPAQGALARR